MRYKLYFGINVKQNLKFTSLYSFRLLRMCEFRGRQKLSLFINFGPIFSPLRNHNFLSSLKEGLKVHLKINFRLLIKSDLNLIFSISFWRNLNFGLNFLFKLHFKQHLKVQLSGVSPPSSLIVRSLKTTRYNPSRNRLWVAHHAPGWCGMLAVEAQSLKDEKVFSQIWLRSGVTRCVRVHHFRRLLSPSLF